MTTPSLIPTGSYGVRQSFSLSSSSSSSPSSSSSSSSSISSLLPSEEEVKNFTAVILSPYPPGWTEDELSPPFERAGFTFVAFVGDSKDGHDMSSATRSSIETRVKYRYNRATDMMQKIDNGDNEGANRFPRWVALGLDEDGLQIARGWGFLDADESEPSSAFDVDVANVEGTYVPQWCNDSADAVNNDTSYILSPAGYDLSPLFSSKIESLAKNLPETSVHVLLHGGTDSKHVMTTADGASFQDILEEKKDGGAGIFCTAIGHLPVFALEHLNTHDSTQSGWLSFESDVCHRHVRLIYPEKKNLSIAAAGELYENRIEAVCGRTGCHLGHYFPANGAAAGRYCINASALIFVRQRQRSGVDQPSSLPKGARPVVRLRDHHSERGAFLDRVINSHTFPHVLMFGAGCFWHVESALRRLHGIIDTECGYAGGSDPDPTYEKVSALGSPTGHAETVRVSYDPMIISTKELVECFMALHNPTVIRAMGRKERGKGCYRSVIFVPEMQEKGEGADGVREIVRHVEIRLGQPVATEVVEMHGIKGGNNIWEEVVNKNLFYSAEDRHQQHDKRMREVEEDDGGRRDTILPLLKW
eukprot:CAMPEP_0113304740 /NCGR_PEP_ID=MMETSP0010_2-20120614/4634_1 /TAXON_ID=216773 ORGANISM="Corethron hystrix, Strain 308" /NCGR_SAMPLE_ID=MMETSP0010_2 /ASSEMBLY_ACC=CAM_ASM_000155 /LENGTH=587 /DNA_ID=CAMNT_0000158995 /DNA_START=186 /DNA_END=1946 /DNA_ORIENTATION=- /assembly_acc=CAM_ASM_000155